MQYQGDVYPRWSPKRRFSEIKKLNPNSVLPIKLKQYNNKYFNPKNGYGGNATYLIRINFIGTLSYDHWDGKEYIDCSDTGCVLCKTGCKKIKCIPAEIKIIYDSRKNEHNQKDKTLIFSMRGMLVDIVNSAISSGLDVTKHILHLKISNSYEGTRFLSYEINENTLNV